MMEESETETIKTAPLLSYSLISGSLFTIKQQLVVICSITSHWVETVADDGFLRPISDLLDDFYFFPSETRAPSGPVRMLWRSVWLSGSSVWLGQRRRACRREQNKCFYTLLAAMDRLRFKQCQNWRSAAVQSKVPRELFLRKICNTVFYWVQACLVKVLLNLIRCNFALKRQPKKLSVCLLKYLSCSYTSTARLECLVWQMSHWGHELVLL